MAIRFEKPSRLCKTPRCRNLHMGMIGWPGNTEVVRLCPSCAKARFGTTDTHAILAALLGVKPFASTRHAAAFLFRGIDVVEAEHTTHPR